MFRSLEHELPTWLEGLLVCCIVHSTASEAATILQLTATNTFIGEYMLNPPPPHSRTMCWRFYLFIFSKLAVITHVVSVFKYPVTGIEPAYLICPELFRRIRVLKKIVPLLSGTLIVKFTLETLDPHNSKMLDPDPLKSLQIHIPQPWWPYFRIC